MRELCCLFWATLFSIVLSAGCGTTRFARWNEIPDADGVNAPESQKLEAEGDSLFNNQDPQSLAAALMKWELAASLQPSPTRFRKLAQGHYLYAQKKSASEHFAQGLGFAEKGLAMAAPNLVSKIKSGIPFKKALAGLPNEGWSILHWYAANLHEWSTHEGLLTRMRYSDDVQAINLAIESNARLSDSKVQK